MGMLRHGDESIFVPMEEIGADTCAEELYRRVMLAQPGAPQEPGFAMSVRDE
jgi:hypothetical protein